MEEAGNWTKYKNMPAENCVLVFEKTSTQFEEKIEKNMCKICRKIYNCEVL